MLSLLLKLVSKEFLMYPNSKDKGTGKSHGSTYFLTNIVKCDSIIVDDIKKSTNDNYKKE